MVSTFKAETSENLRKRVHGLIARTTDFDDYYDDGRESLLRTTCMWPFRYSQTSMLNFKYSDLNKYTSRN